VLGLVYSALSPLLCNRTAKGEAELFYCKGSGADGVDEYTTEGFVVLFSIPSQAAMVLLGRSANGCQFAMFLVAFCAYSTGALGLFNATPQPPK
jgi:hypothetical protein